MELFKFKCLHLPLKKCRPIVESDNIARVVGSTVKLGAEITKIAQKITIIVLSLNKVKCFYKELTHKFHEHLLVTPTTAITHTFAHKTANFLRSIGPSNILRCCCSFNHQFIVTICRMKYTVLSPPSWHTVASLSRQSPNPAPCHRVQVSYSLRQILMLHTSTSARNQILSVINPPSICWLWFYKEIISVVCDSG